MNMLKANTDMAGRTQAIVMAERRGMLRRDAEADAAPWLMSHRQMPTPPRASLERLTWPSVEEIRHDTESLASRVSLILLTVLAAACMAWVAMTHVARAGEPPDAKEGFMGESMQAMDRMMAGMNVAPSGNADRDFVAMMVPHHQGAIDMALAELRHGKDETLRRMAQEIIVEQRQEIAAMRLALASLPANGPALLPDTDICTSRPLTHTADPILARKPST